MSRKVPTAATRDILATEYPTVRKARPSYRSRQQPSARVYSDDVDDDDDGNNMNTEEHQQQPLLPIQRKPQEHQHSQQPYAHIPAQQSTLPPVPLHYDYFFNGLPPPSNMTSATSASTCPEYVHYANHQPLTADGNTADEPLTQHGQMQQAGSSGQSALLTILVLNFVGYVLVLLTLLAGLHRPATPSTILLSLLIWVVGFLPFILSAAGSVKDCLMILTWPKNRLPMKMTFAQDLTRTALYASLLGAVVLSIYTPLDSETILQRWPYAPALGFIGGYVLGLVFALLQAIIA